MTMTDAAPAACGDAVLTFHAGFDTDAFPGLDAMAWLKGNTNLEFTGFYLGPAPSHPDTGWMDQRAALAAQGWGFLPIYVGQELAGPGSHQVSGQQGADDGDEAGRLMHAAGFPANATVYLDLEDGAPFVEPRVSYVKYWAGAVFGQGYMPGVYCSHAIADAVAAIFSAESVEAPRIWAFRVSTVALHRVFGPFEDDPPAGSGFANATAWQHDQNALIDAGAKALQVDLSTALFPDPSAA